MARVVLHTFESRLVEGYQLPTVTVQNGPGHVVISGGLSVTGSACEIESLATQRYRTLVLRVTSIPEYEGAARVLDYGYTAKLLDLKPGKYQLQVRHAVLMPRADGSTQVASMTVFEGEVRSEEGSGEENDRGGHAVVYRNRVQPGARKL